jgi:hypothetical protein
MATKEVVILLPIDEAASFGFVLLGVAAERATEIIQVCLLLLEMLKPKRHHAQVFAINECAQFTSPR